jgi:hypothetical protein
MNKKFKSLNDAFGIEPSLVTAEVEVSPVDVQPVLVDDKSTNFNDIRADYEYSRATLTQLVGKGQEAIDDLLEVAQETSSARAYEVVSILIKTVADSAEKLMDVQKKLKDLETEKTTNTVTNNALFVGTTSEVLAMLKSELRPKANKHNKNINNKKETKDNE